MAILPWYGPTPAKHHCIFCVLAPLRFSRLCVELPPVIPKVYGRSWKAVEGGGRSWKVTFLPIPSVVLLACRVEIRWRRVLACRAGVRLLTSELGLTF